MKSCFRQAATVLLLAAALTGCANRETKEAIQKARALEDQKQYQSADDVLVSALQARESKIRANFPPAADQIAADDQTKKVQSDSEILRMERAQIPIYLLLERADLASAVYSDILAGDPGDTSIYDYVGDKDPVIRTGVARVLGLAAQPKAINALTTLTKDSDQDVRRAAVAALGSIKDPQTVPPLIDALKDSYWFVRSDAADALGRENDPRAIKPLLDLVADSDSTVESSAENALVLLAMSHAPGDDYAARMDDPNSRIATIATVCLGLEKDPRALPILLKLATAADPAVRLQAVKALGEIGDASAIPTLRQGLNDSALSVKGWSIIGLGKLGDTASIPTLRAIAADPSQPPSIQRAATASVNHLTGAPPADDAGGATGP